MLLYKPGLILTGKRAFKMIQLFMNGLGAGRALGMSNFSTTSKSDENFVDNVDRQHQSEASPRLL